MLNFWLFFEKLDRRKIDRRKCIFTYHTTNVMNALYGIKYNCGQKNNLNKIIIKMAYELICIVKIIIVWITNSILYQNSNYFKIKQVADFCQHPSWWVLKAALYIMSRRQTVISPIECCCIFFLYFFVFFCDVFLDLVLWSVFFSVLS